VICRFPVFSFPGAGKKKRDPPREKIKKKNFCFWEFFWVLSGRELTAGVWTRREKRAGGAPGEIPRSLGGPDHQQPCAPVEISTVFCTIFARGLDDNLYELRQTSVNGVWPATPGTGPARRRVLTLPGGSLHAPGGPPPSASLNGDIEVYAVASDHSVWTIRQRPDGPTPDLISASEGKGLDRAWTCGCVS